ncbi:MAG: sulfide/dihydroorotate dehydrogenase-like FAD/NAD-binding protein [Bacillota bacterium]|nr:sulfide/dihydroorotate dehydrogenase-like FAD/NAD-binding protein [Bacillota bacterium]
MYKVVKREQLTENVVLMEVEAPLVAKKCLPGQFIILRVNEQGERIPLTVAGYDREKGTVRIIYQIVGKTTQILSELKEGEAILDFVGPLGTPSHTEGIKKAAVIGGGLGCAIAYPQAKALFDKGADVTMIAGFRSKDFVILEDEMKKASNKLYIMSDDGSYGEHGLVTNKLEELLKAGEVFDTVIAIGPLIMMKFVCQLTKKYNVKTIVSMNPIMIDGTGMCGGCRLTVDGKTKFACVDGPDFDGHLVDFDEAIRRSRMYSSKEREAMEKHKCRLEGMNSGK